ncbi:MAG: putative Na(+)/H(+) antiporter subunit [Burkholderiales bacterium]|nr:putative Na(+)/H(+) antiporter subunit [Burkholderiales bacterium]
MNRRRAREALALVATLYAFWLLLSGIYQPFLLAAGLACAVAVAALAWRMEVLDREGHPIHIALAAAFGYWPWLAKEIAKAAITVEAEHGEFLVHALTREAAAGVVDSEMDRRVSRLDR